MGRESIGDDERTGRPKEATNVFEFYFEGLISWSTGGQSALM
jgi:hypothetical protein